MITLRVLSALFIFILCSFVTPSAADACSPLVIKNSSGVNIPLTIYGDDGGVHPIGLPPSSSDSGLSSWDVIAIEAAGFFYFPTGIWPVFGMPGVTSVIITPCSIEFL